MLSTPRVIAELKTRDESVLGNLAVEIVVAQVAAHTTDTPCESTGLVDQDNSGLHAVEDGLDAVEDRLVRRWPCLAFHLGRGEHAHDSENGEHRGAEPKL